MKVIAIAFIVLTIGYCYAQKDTTYWKKSFESGLNINQNAFNVEWKIVNGGGNNASLSLFLFTKSEYVQYRHSMLNDIQMQYGRTFNENNLIPTWRKNLDRIFVDNKYAYALSDRLGLFASVVFQSQFSDGFKYEKHKNVALASDPSGQTVRDSATKISTFLAPGYLDEALGIEWKPTGYLALRAGPMAMRQIFQTNEEVFANTRKFSEKENKFSSYGVFENTQVRNQMGYNLLVKFDKDLATNINLKLIGQYFSPYQDLQTATARADAIFTAKITKVFNVNISSTVVYNQDQILLVQIAQTMALGIVYKVSNNQK